MRHFYALFGMYFFIWCMCAKDTICMIFEHKNSNIFKVC